MAGRMTEEVSEHVDERTVGLHDRILKIDLQIAELTHQKALLRAAAIRSLHSAMDLPHEIVGELAAGCR